MMQDTSKFPMFMSVAQVISGQPMSDRVNSAQCPLFPSLASCLITQRLSAPLPSIIRTSTQVQHCVLYAAARTFATLFLTSNLCCFLNLITLNLSKSVSSRLLELRARPLAHALSAHFLSMSVASHCFLMAPVPAARGILSMTMCVRATCARGAAWRGTWRVLSEEGPSTRICEVDISGCSGVSSFVRLDLEVELSPEALCNARKSSANLPLRCLLFLSSLHPQPSVLYCFMLFPLFLLEQHPRYTYTLVVNDLGNSSKASLVFARCEKNDTADLNEAPLRCGNVSFTHYADMRL